VLISILGLTRSGPVSHELIKKRVRIPSIVGDELLRKLQNEGLIYVHANMVEASSAQRLRMAVLAIRSGADLERVSSCLQWKEFEDIAAVAFGINGYTVIRNLHFKHGGHRWEIDIIGCKGSLVICLDCKHWHHGLHGLTVQKIAKEQVERTRALVMSLPNPKVKVGCLSMANGKFVPAVMSLSSDKFKFQNGVPIVPVLQLQNFLNELPMHTDSLLYFTPNNAQKRDFV
jgi:Holliday junction resolvase-like predicted endonuclease